MKIANLFSQKASQETEHISAEVQYAEKDAWREPYHYKNFINQSARFYTGSKK